jgi:hypothetical protein
VIASGVITDLAFVVYLVNQALNSRSHATHAGEEAFLIPIIFVVVTAPTVFLSAFGFGRMASRVYQCAAAKQPGACSPPVEGPPESPDSV